MHFLYFFRKYHLISKKIFQVDEFGESILSGDKRYEKKTPKESSLNKDISKILVTVDELNIIKSYWVKEKDDDLSQVNTKDKEGGIAFKINYWIRNKAIEAVGLEIRSMKKKAYEYSTDELTKMIEKEEEKMIKKGGWKALKMAALSTLGLSWLPFV